MEKIKILCVGKTDFTYNRTAVLISGLRKLENVQVTLFSLQKKNSKEREQLTQMAKDHDLIYIPPFRHTDVSFVKKSCQKPVIFDPLISKYLTKVVDYNHFWKAPLKYFADLVPFKKCDVLIADTVEHQEYFSQKFNISKDKIKVVEVGVDTAEFYPKVSLEDKEVFRVGFYGTFNPLQGIDKILGAAKILEEEKNLEIVILGSGYLFKDMQKISVNLGLKNVNFQGWVAYDELNDLMNNFDVCLGIFGDSLKSDWVVPNKIFHYAALGKSIITKKSSAIERVFKDGQSIILCENNAADLAQKILGIKNNPENRQLLGEGALAVIRKDYNEIAIAERFLEGVKHLIN